MRRLSGAAVIAMVLLMVGGGVSASAAPQLPPIPGTDCTHAPEPSSPSMGAMAAIDPGPDGLLDGDPWAKDATVSIYDVYGYAGLDSVRYDPGCADIGSGFTNSLSNGVAAINTLAVAITVRLARIAFNPTTMAILEPIQATAVKALGSSIFLPLIGIAGAITGLWIMWRAHRADPSESARHGSWAVLVTAIAMATILYPITIGATVDKAMTGAVSEVNKAVTLSPNRNLPDSLAASLHHSLLYETWASKTFGRNGATAQRFGPRLFKAGALTRAEQARINANPAVGKTLIEAKKEAYKRVAAQIKDTDPQAYTYLAGHQDGSRLSTAGLALVGTICAVAFLLMAMARLLLAMVMTRLGIAATPLIAVLAQHPRLRGLLTGTLDAMAAAVISAVVFGCLAVVYVGAVANTLLSPTSQVDPVLAYIVMAVVSLLAWWGSRKLAGRVLAPKSLARLREGLRRRDRTREDNDDTSNGPTLDRVYHQTPNHSTYQHATPIEASQRPPLGAVLTSAAQGAITSVALGAISGGAATMATTAAGATRGAIAATSANTLAESCTRAPDTTTAPGPMLTAVPNPVANPAAGSGALALTAQPATVQSGAAPALTAVAATVQSDGAVPTRPVRVPAVPVELYEPGQQAREIKVGTRTRQGHQDVYDIYTPTPSSDRQEVPA